MLEGGLVPLLQFVGFVDKLTAGPKAGGEIPYALRRKNYWKSISSAGSWKVSSSWVSSHSRSFSMALSL